MTSDPRSCGAPQTTSAHLFFLTDTMLKTSSRHKVPTDKKTPPHASHQTSVERLGSQKIQHRLETRQSCLCVGHTCVGALPQEDSVERWSLSPSAKSLRVERTQVSRFGVRAVIAACVAFCGHLGWRTWSRIMVRQNASCRLSSRTHFLLRPM